MGSAQGGGVQRGVWADHPLPHTLTRSPAKGSHHISSLPVYAPSSHFPPVTSRCVAPRLRPVPRPVGWYPGRLDSPSSWRPPGASPLFPASPCSTTAGRSFGRVVTSEDVPVFARRARPAG